MAADAGIFQQYLNPVRSVADYRGDMDKQEQNALTLAAGRLSNQTAQQGLADDQAARQAWTSSGGDPTKAVNALQAAGLFKQAQAAQKGMLENQASQAKITQLGAQSADSEQKVASSRAQAIGQTLGALSKIEGGATPLHVTNAMQHMVDIGQISPEMAQKIVAGAPSDQSQMQGWLLQGQRAVLGVKDQLPKYQTIDTGGAVNTGTVDPVTGAFTPVKSMAKTQTPESIAVDARAAKAQAQAERHWQADQSAAAAEVESPAAIEKMAQGIASGRLAPMSSFAMLKPSGKAIMGRVLDINPTYDSGDYLSKNKALRDYGTGTQGMAIQAANTGLNHLDTIEQLATAQKNGNTRLFNSLANRIATETGGAAPTNLGAAISMVAPEVSKMVIGAAGGQEERATFAKNFNPNASPEQTLGGIKTMRELLGGRLSEAERTYKRATGRDDFSSGMLSPAAQKVLSARGGAGTAPSATDIHAQADAILKGK
jgi:hypothetical protein